MLDFEVNTSENAVMLKKLRHAWVDLSFGVQSRLCLRMTFHENCSSQSRAKTEPTE